MCSTLDFAKHIRNVYQRQSDTDSSKLLLNRVKEFVRADRSDPLLPNGICPKHRVLLEKVAKGSMSSDGIPKHDFSQPQYTFPTKTRSTLYLCWMCELGRVKTQQKTPEKSSTSPLPDSSNDDSLPPPVPITLCQRCLSPVGRGYHHPQPCGLAQCHCSTAIMYSVRPTFHPNFYRSNS